jgi:antitoxin (DNA-binding transcriptional repressor) of toxin-antitoxin stability system
MEKRISATQAVRDFSEVLNTIKFKGVHYIIERSGKPIACMKSIDEKVDPMTLADLKNLLKKLPKLEKELDAFASDIAEISNYQPLIPSGDSWE